MAGTPRPARQALMKSGVEDLAVFGGGRRSQPPYTSAGRMWGTATVCSPAERPARPALAVERRPVCPGVRGHWRRGSACATRCGGQWHRRPRHRDPCRRPDGEVIVPSFTFVATSHALLWQGLTPVFCDVDPRTHNLSPESVEALITPRHRHHWGAHLGPGVRRGRARRIARRHGLTLLFDAAHALLCSHRGRMIGGFGEPRCSAFTPPSS